MMIAEVPLDVPRPTADGIITPRTGAELAACAGRLAACRRILVVGCSGAGKTTFAGLLGARLGLPVEHMDKHFWHPGWVETPQPEWDGVVERLAAGERWVIDGNYRSSLPLRLPRAEAVVFLDLPAPLCLWRVIKRMLSGWGRVRENMPAGCPEHFDWPFLLWVMGYRRRSRPKVLALLAEYAPGRLMLRLTAPRTVARLLSALPAGRAG